MTHLANTFPIRALAFSRLATWALVLAALGTLPRPALSADPSPATFYRGLNLNGPPVVIEGRRWEGKEAQNYTIEGKTFENQGVPLRPSTDPDRARMIRSSVWESNVKVTLRAVPKGTYQVLLYVWEDNDPATYSLTLNGRVVVPRHTSGKAGQWHRLGPWPVTVTGGTIQIVGSGGHANLSGIEVWAGEGPVPGAIREGDRELRTTTPDTPEGIAFFENSVRPLLIKHCYSCHSAEAKKVRGELLLDSREGTRKGGSTGPAVVPGDLKKSLLITAVHHKDDALQMPPKEKLSADEIAALEAWVRMGAPDPRLQGVAPPKTIDLARAKEFWSLRPVRDPPPPAVQNINWPLNPVDRFVLARMEARGLHPVGQADKRTLIRRATYDLTGLPPTPEEIDAFLEDNSPEAFARVVDRLLASSAYGERWGRHWLDVVRYADTAGDNSDYPIPQLYRYRNWVIEAFNRDMPYDQFVQEQLAGDLMTPRNDQDRQEKIIATGYLANARRFGSYEDARYPWHLTIEDTIDNLGRTFLGLTLSCCRCHDHKFDPLSNEDYYALYGFFHSTRYPWPGIELDKAPHDLVPLASAAEIEVAEKERRQKLAGFDARIKQLEQEKAQAGRDLQAAEKGGKPEDRQARVAAANKRVTQLNNALKAVRKEREAVAKAPVAYELAYAVAEAKEGGKRKVGNVCIQIKGDPERLGPEVPRRFPTVLGGRMLSPDTPGSGRLELARWLTEPSNPLTARVMVNRLWHYHFGKGLVPTPSDFGKQGLPPSHPELLDYLACRFVEAGWSMKAMHRLLMLSQTYQLASDHDADNARIDVQGDNLWRFRRQRLDAESVRDTLLAVSGALDRSRGGPHPFPAQTTWNFTQHNPFKAVYETDQRSVYLMTQRIQRHPFLGLFDGPDTNASTARRVTSTTPLQALYLMNDPFIHEQARHLAARLLKDHPSESERIERMFLLMFGRPVQAEERAVVQAYLGAVREKVRKDGLSAAQQSEKAWESCVRAFFLSNEFLYVN